MSGASSYNLPTASSSALGGIKVGNNLSIDGNGVLSGASSYNLPTASASTLGGIKVGTGLSISNGVLSASSSGVPYTGATQAVNLGAFDLTVNGITVGLGKNGIDNNVAIGQSALSNTTSGFQGNYLTAVGYEALKTNTWGYFNTAIGSSSLFSNTTGLANTSIGSNSLLNNTTANFNTAVGTSALRNNTTGENNTASGASSLVNNTTGEQNSAFGRNALESNTTGSINTATGVGALSSNTAGGANTANGASALTSNIAGGGNTAMGNNALRNTNSSENTAIGNNAGVLNTTGTNNTAIGGYANFGANNLTNATALGYQATVSASNTIQLGNSSVTNVKTGGTITAGAITYPSTHGTSGQVLSTTGSGTLTWTTASGGGVSSIGAISGSSTANGGSITAGVLNLAPADVTNGGIVTTGNQAFSGGKVFNNNIQVNSVRIGAPGSAGSANTMLGAYSFQYGSPGGNNTGVGTMSLASITNSNNGGSPGGNDNTAVGTNAIRQGQGASNGNRNTAVGSSALTNASDASDNTALGYATLPIATGGANTAVGSNSLAAITSGTNNTAIGYGATVSLGTQTNSTAIGNGAIASASNLIQLGNISVTNVKTSGTITAGTVTYPNTHGTIGQVLSTTGSGTLTWTTASGVGSGVPYTGAIGAVDLGLNDLAVGGIKIAQGGGKIGFGTANPNAQSSIDIATALPVIFPKMNQTQLNAVTNPSIAMIQFNSTANKFQVYKEINSSAATVFGNSTVGNSSTCLSNGELWFRPTISGLITQIELYSANAGEMASLVINSGYSNPFPINLNPTVLGTSNSITSIAGWNTWTFATPVAVTANTTYYITSNDATHCLGVMWASSGDDPTTGNINSMNMSLMSNSNVLDNVDPASRITVVVPSTSNAWVDIKDGGAKMNLTSEVSGILPIENGGTGSSASLWSIASNNIYRAKGNVGLGSGSSSPSAKLHVFGGDRNSGIRVESSENASISFKNTDSGGGSDNDGEYQIFATGHPSNSAIAAGSLGIYYDHPTAAGYRFSINKEGYVGIGTGRPTTKLDVTGNIKSSGTITAAALALGVSSPAASALLEVSSTSKGLLPPRMTYAQKEAIISPATGLLIYCTNCGRNGGEPQFYNGSFWVNMVGGTASVPETDPSVLIVVGANYRGGKVAYILAPGDPGYDANTKHGLIAAASDLSPTNGYGWNNGFSFTTGATGSAIGTGFSNTNTIITAQGNGSYAANAARDYRGGGYNDWYLPSKDELHKLWLNNQAIGGFVYTFYSTSTEINSGEIASQYFYDGSQQVNTSKSSGLSVRPVRSF